MSPEVAARRLREDRLSRLAGVPRSPWKRGCPFLRQGLLSWVRKVDRAVGPHRKRFHRRLWQGQAALLMPGLEGRGAPLLSAWRGGSRAP